MMKSSILTHSIAIEFAQTCRWQPEIVFLRLHVSGEGSDYPVQPYYLIRVFGNHSLHKQGYRVYIF